jgi:hypothetical protein
MTVTRRGSTGALLRLTAVQTAGQTGTWAGYVAALPAALAQPRPAVALSLVTLAWSFPSIAARLAGGITDRHGPHRTGAVSWGLAAVAAMVPVVTRPGLPALLLVLAVLALGGTWGVAAGEVTPTWLPGLGDPALGGPWLAIATNLALTIAPIITTSLLTCSGDRAAWGLVATLSAAAAVGTLLTPAQPPMRTAASKQRAQMPPAVRRVLASTAGVYLSMGTITILEPLYVRQVLASPLIIYGGLLAVVGTAGILTSLAAKLWPRITCGRWAVPAATLTLAAGTILYINTPYSLCAFCGAAVFGIGTALFRLSARMVIVQAVPGSAHGRAFGLWETVQCGFSVIPTVFTGSLVAVLGLRAVLRCCGGLAGGVAAASLRATGPTSPPPQQATRALSPAQELRPHRIAQPSFTLSTGAGLLSRPDPPPPGRLDPTRYQLPRTTRQPVDCAAEGGTSRAGD